MNEDAANDLSLAQAAGVARIQARDGCGLDEAIGRYFGPLEPAPVPSCISEGTLDFIEDRRRDYEADPS